MCNEQFQKTDVVCTASMNPYRDVTIGIELGERVRIAMMTYQDWDEVLKLVSGRHIWQ